MLSINFCSSSQISAQRLALYSGCRNVILCRIAWFSLVTRSSSRCLFSLFKLKKNNPKNHYRTTQTSHLGRSQYPSQSNKINHFTNSNSSFVTSSFCKISIITCTYMIKKSRGILKKRILQYLINPVVCTNNYRNLVKNILSILGST